MESIISNRFYKVFDRGLGLLKTAGSQDFRARPSACPRTLGISAADLVLVPKIGKSGRQKNMGADAYNSVKTMERLEQLEKLESWNSVITEKTPPKK